MNILIICRNGGCLVTFNTIKRLGEQGYRLTILSISTPKRQIPENLPPNISGLATCYYQLHKVDLLATLSDQDRFELQGMVISLMIEAVEYDFPELKEKRDLFVLGSME